MSQFSNFGKFLGLSLLIHVGSLTSLQFFDEKPKPKKKDIVKFRVQTPEKKTPPPEEAKIIPPKVPKKPKPKPKSERKPKKKPVQQAKAVQGVSTNALSKKADGKGFKAPLGNTLMEKDRGIRLKAEDVDSLKKDLSREARLIPSSVVKPQYTDDAIDINLEGIFVVDVFVDAQGRVLEAELEDKIGYGMDSRVIRAAKRAKFEPRQNKLGKSISGWTQVRFLLEIE